MSNEPLVVILNCKFAISGVSTSIFALQNFLENKSQQIFFYGYQPEGYHFRKITLFKIFKIAFTATNKPLIIHARRDHDVLLASLIKFIARRPVKILFTWVALRKKGLVSSWIVKKSDQIITTSEEAAIYAPHSVKTIHHGVDIAFWGQGKKKNTEKNTTNIAIIGRVRSEKGVDIFVKAMLKLRDQAIKCYIVGSCTVNNIAFKKELEKYIAENGATDLFEWVDEITYRQMPEFLQKIDIVVACPKYEGFGLTLFEAAAAGCAIIGSNTGAFPLLIGENERGKLIPTGDIEALYQGVKEWLENPDSMRASAEKANEYVKNKFSLEREAEEIFTLYKS
jgi:mannosyltransferase